MKLTHDNGNVHEASVMCDACETAGLLEIYSYCPFCGHELDS